jgi:Fusaric acid resistance protein-like
LNALLSANRALRSLTGDAWIFDPLGAGVRVPAIAAALVAGIVVGHPLVGALAAGGAFTVGFGAPLDLRGSNPLLLVLATFAIGASAVAGSVAGGHAVTATLVIMGLGALYETATSRGPGLSWIALQCALTGILASSHPASLEGASSRAVAIVAGGLAQTLLLSLARLAQRPAPPAATEAEPARYALHLASALGLATAIEQTLGLRNGYWVPLTTLLVLRAGTRKTLTRAISRTVGTLGGAALASSVLTMTGPSKPVLASLVALAALGAYVFQKATYGLFSACVTAYVVFILSFAGAPDRRVAVARIVATALGAAIGLAVEGAHAANRRRRLRADAGARSREGTSSTTQ